jgi:hypothetical protein
VVVDAHEVALGEVFPHCTSITRSGSEPGFPTVAANPTGMKGDSLPRGVDALAGGHASLAVDPVAAHVESLARARFPDGSRQIA